MCNCQDDFQKVELTVKNSRQARALGYHMTAWHPSQTNPFDINKNCEFHKAWLDGVKDFWIDFDVRR